MRTCVTDISEVLVSIKCDKASNVINVASIRVLRN